MIRKVVGRAVSEIVSTRVALDDDGRMQLIAKQRHYTTDIVEEAKDLGGMDAESIWLARIEDDCKRWAHILKRLPFPNDYVALRRSGQAARWFDTAYEKGVDQAPIKVTKTARGVEIQHEAPRARRIGLSPEDMTFLDAMMDVLLTLGWNSFAWVLVTGRAARRPWAELERLDPERRRERQLRNVHRKTLTNLLPVWRARVHKM